MLHLLQPRLDSVPLAIKTSFMTEHLADAGLRTLAYAAVFGRGLTLRQLSRFLISSHHYTTGSVRMLWERWRAAGLVQTSTIPPQMPHWRKTFAIRDLALFVPWVQSVWVTGSLAAGTAQVDDDIDFLVITDANRLWLSRIFLVGLSVLFGRARTRYMPENHVRDRWCFNMWLEPDLMAMPIHLQNLYTAREVVQAVPIYVRPGVGASDFLQRNIWAQKFFSRGWQMAYTKAAGWNDSSRRKVARESFRLLDIFNDLAWKWQKRRMGLVQSREVVEKNQAFFHPRDTRTSVKQEYERICTLLELKPYA
jgi:hypothetical protein